MNNLNLAHNLERIPEIRKSSKKNNIIKIPSKREILNEKLKSKRLFMISSVLTFSIVAGIACVFMAGQATLVELNDKALKVSTVLKEVESINTQLNVKAKIVRFNKTDDNRSRIETVKINKENKSEVIKN